jgi:hypothetical protein
VNLTIIQASVNRVNLGFYLTNLNLWYILIQSQNPGGFFHRF